MIAFSDAVAREQLGLVDGKPVMAAGWDGTFGVGIWRTRGNHKAVVKEVISTKRGEVAIYPLVGFIVGQDAINRSWTSEGAAMSSAAEHIFDLVAPWVDGHSVEAAKPEPECAVAAPNGGKPVVKAFGYHFLAIEADFADPVKFLLQLITAHDGSLAEALSRAIVARANEIGLQVLCSPVVRQAHHEGIASDGAKK
jgi:hypothetical protein